MSKQEEASIDHVMDGLQILGKYSKDEDANDVGVGHGIIVSGFDVNPDVVLVDDLDNLDSLGWRWDDENQRWGKFV